MRRTVRYGSMMLAAAMLLGVGAALIAPATAQDKMAVVKERQALMKSNGADAGKISAFLQKGQGSAADVAAAAGDIAAHMKKLPTLFVAGTSSADLPGKTRAKPELLANKAKAEKHAMEVGEKAMALQAAAKAGDKQAMQAAFRGMVRGGCGACHNEFRGPPLN